jgi:DNA invertase Pin-like site-specific DNA recombinase
MANKDQGKTSAPSEAQASILSMGRRHGFSQIYARKGQKGKAQNLFKRPSLEAALGALKDHVANVPSPKDRKRSGFKRALEALQSGREDTLVITKTGTPTEVLSALNSLMAPVVEVGWALMALDYSIVSKRTPKEPIVCVIATLAQYDRAIIAKRTREALAAKKARGEPLGRPRKVPAKVRRRIEREREKGKTLGAIADGLNDDQVPTAHGGKKWWPETVRVILAQS